MNEEQLILLFYYLLKRNELFNYYIFAYYNLYEPIICNIKNESQLVTLFYSVSKIDELHNRSSNHSKYFGLIHSIQYGIAIEINYLRGISRFESATPLYRQLRENYSDYITERKK